MEHATNTIVNLVSDFRQSLPCLRLNNRLTGGTPTHPQPPKAFDLQYTFGGHEIADALGQKDTRFVVHHGDAARHADVCMVRLLDEHLMMWVGQARGSVSLSHSAVAGIFTHRIRTWSQLGRGPGRIRLLGHGGPINRRVLDAFIARHYGSTIAAPVEWFASYEELSHAAEDCDECVVLGLRAAHVDPERLVPVLIDGIKPWAAGEGCGVPHMRISLGWRADDVPPRQQIAEYLDLVARHLSADASVMDRIGWSNEEASDVSPRPQAGTPA